MGVILLEEARTKLANRFVYLLYMRLCTTHIHITYSLPETDCRLKKKYIFEKKFSISFLIYMRESSRLYAHMTKTNAEMEQQLFPMQSSVLYANQGTI